MTYIGWYHVKADVQSFPKMWDLLSVSGFKPQLLAVKVRSNFEKKFDGEGAVKKKTRPQFCVLGPEIESAQKKHGWLHADSISGPKSQNCVGNIFFTAPSPTNFFSKFEPTLTANSYGLKTPNLKNYHIFGKLRTSAFTGYPPIQVIPFQNVE